MSLQTAETTDRPSTRFTWKIANFSELKTKKLYSEIFSVRGFKWRVLLFPKGNNTDCLSVYLDVADSATLPHGWNRYADFSLGVTNQLHGYTARKDAQHEFNEEESDWGFTSFMPLRELHDPTRGFMAKDTVIVKADVTVKEPQDSEKQTGFVGSEKECQQDNSSGNANVQIDVTGTSPPPQQSLEPTLGSLSLSVDSSHLGLSEVSNIANSEDTAPPGKVRFLSFWVSSEASWVLEKIHGLGMETFTKFSMKGRLMQTGVLESFASYIVSMSTIKVNAVNEESLSRAAISIEDFEQVGLELSWLKQRLDEAKRVNKHSESLVYVDLCESALKVARAKVCELEEGLTKAKAETEYRLRDLPTSLGVDDCLLKDFL